MIMEMGTITSTLTVMDITSRHRRRLLPRTTFTTPPLTAACNHDPRIYEAHALTARDPAKWFAIAVDEDGIARPGCGTLWSNCVPPGSGTKAKPMAA